ncbi:FAD/NAD(P)-binding domain-containing protein [Periconia macrospinosa]|uniref:FAD/NAD(P)-binding domain-containing protein n=1 Tax=Periconia macrospinosa TaxID=97972 RepID=A0A2V1E3H4_9PLEO|nr:FAD/NAD(P)-binding domain-containing protein [Periconia macrospinosa]
MAQASVLIVGASISGPMVAYWFARSGANITVIERFPKLRPGGQNVDIRTVGVTVMRKIPGMEEDVRSKTINLESIQLVRSNGKPIATMKTTGDPEQQSLVSEFEIFRDDLSQTLYDLTIAHENVKYVFGEQISALYHKEDHKGVTVEFKNGKLPTTEYDLVVACDGTNSKTRALGFNCGVSDHVVPINAWAAYFSVEKDYLAGKNLGQMHTAIGGRAMACGPNTTSGNRVTAMAIFPRKDTSAMALFREAQKSGEDVLKKYVAQHYQGVGWKIPEILEEMMTSDNFYASEWAQVKVPKLYNGRVVLVGDAGYAAGPTGGGTSLAMAGAYVLAGEICEHKGDIETGLEAYEQRMKPIIADLQKIPPGVPGILAPQTQWGIWLRNAILIIVTWSSGAFGWVSKLFASSFGKNKYGLPDYKWEM